MNMMKKDELNLKIISLDFQYFRVQAHWLTPFFFSGLPVVGIAIVLAVSRKGFDGIVTEDCDFV